MLDSVYFCFALLYHSMIFVTIIVQYCLENIFLSFLKNVLFFLSNAQQLMCCSQDLMGEGVVTCN